MLKTVIDNSEFEQWRSVREMSVFIESVISKIRDVQDAQRAYFHLSQSNYKYFKEEYVPVFDYLKHQYGLVDDVFYRHVGMGNQQYDGEIKRKRKVTRIEIGRPILGKEYKERQLDILENGQTTHEYDEQLFPRIKQVILETAAKKARKPYRKTLLMLYYAFGEQLYPGDLELSEEMFEQLIDELRAIKYKAKRIDFFIPAFGYIGDKKYEKPARLYRIKG